VQATSLVSCRNKYIAAEVTHRIDYQAGMAVSCCHTLHYIMAATGCCSTRHRPLLAQPRCNSESQLQRLRSVEPGITMRVIMRIQAINGDLLRSPNAFRNILPSHLQMDPPGWLPSCSCTSKNALSSDYTNICMRIYVCQCSKLIIGLRHDRFRFLTQIASQIGARR